MSLLLFIPVILGIIALSARLRFSAAPTGGSLVPVTVVIAARNESEHIGDLVSQLQKQGFDEVIVVDDNSEDDTVAVAEKAGAVVVPLNERKGKKAAIDLGVRNATHNHVLQIDADVKLKPDYRSFLNQEFLHDRDMIVLPVRLKETGSMIGELQRIEQNALLWISAFLARRRHPLVANGANLIYRKDAFLELEPFANNDTIASGDDQFLLSSMIDAGNVVELELHNGLVVETEPESSLRGFINQRLRWAGKMFHAWSIQSLFLSALFFLLLLIPLAHGIAMSIGYLEFSWIALSMIGFWYLFPILLLLDINRTLGDSTNVFLIPLWSILFSIYAPLIGIVSIFVKPSWKGRKI